MYIYKVRFVYNLAPRFPNINDSSVRAGLVVTPSLFSFLHWIFSFPLSFPAFVFHFPDSSSYITNGREISPATILRTPCQPLSLKPSVTVQVFGTQLIDFPAPGVRFSCSCSSSGSSSSSSVQTTHRRSVFLLHNLSATLRSSGQSVFLLRLCCSVVFLGFRFPAHCSRLRLPLQVFNSSTQQGIFSGLG